MSVANRIDQMSGINYPLALEPLSITSRFYERDRHYKWASFTKNAFGFDGAFVGLNHRFYVAESKAKTLNIVDVAGVGTVKFLENTIERFFVHTDAVVIDLNSKVIARNRCGKGDLWIFAGVF